MGGGCDERTCKKNHMQLCMLSMCTQWHKQRLAKAYMTLCFFFLFLLFTSKLPILMRFIAICLTGRQKKKKKKKKREEIVIVNRVFKIWKVRWPFGSSTLFFRITFCSDYSRNCFCMSDGFRYQLASRMSFVVSSVQKGVLVFDFAALCFKVSRVHFVLSWAEQSSPHVRCVPYMGCGKVQTGLFMGSRQQSFSLFFFLAALPQRPGFGIASLEVFLATDSSTCTCGSPQFLQSQNRPPDSP